MHYGLQVLSIEKHLKATILVLLTLGGYIGRFMIEKDMPFYCVAANCTNKVCLKDGISLHNIPYFNDEHTEAKRPKRQRKVRVDFVCAKRLFVPSNTSTICSDHCRTEDYERQFFSLPGLGKPNYPVYPKLIKTDDDLLCFDDSICNCISVLRAC